MAPGSEALRARAQSDVRSVSDVASFERRRPATPVREDGEVHGSLDSGLTHGLRSQRPRQHWHRLGFVGCETLAIASVMPSGLIIFRTPAQVMGLADEFEEVIGMALPSGDALRLSARRCGSLNVVPCNAQMPEALKSVLLDLSRKETTWQATRS